MIIKLLQNIFKFCLLFSLIITGLILITHSVLGSTTLYSYTFFQQSNDTLPVAPARDTTKEKQSKTSADFIKTKIKYTARDSIIMSRTTNKIYLYKNAQVTYGEIELKADYIEYNQDSNYVFARGMKDSTGKIAGEPVFSEGGETYNAKQIRYNFKTQEGYIKQVVTEEEEGFLHGEETKKHANNHFHFKDGKYTTCDKSHPDFYISISKGIVVPNERIVAGPSYLVIEDIPLPLILPFGYFPIQKKQASGLIMPSYGEESRKGFYLQNLGYYFGISERMDMQIMADVYSRGSWNVGLTYRLMERYKYTSNLQLDYKRFVKGDKGSPDYFASRDYSIQWIHNQDQKANPYSSFKANVDYSTSTYDRLHSRNLDTYASNTKSSSISYSKSWPDSPFQFTGKLRHSQNSTTRIVDLTAPEMSFNMSRQYPFRQLNKSGKSKWYDNIQISYNANLKNRIKQPDSTLFKNIQFSDFQSGFQHRIPVSLNFKVLKYINITPNFNYSGVLYPRSIRKTWSDSLDRPVRDTVEQFRYAHSLEPSLSMGLSPKFFGMYQFNSETFKVQAIRHVLTPSVNFSFTPDLGDMTARYYGAYRDSGGVFREYSYFEGQLYRPPRPPGRSGSVNFSLSNNIEMKVRTQTDTAENVKKVPLLRNLSFSTNYNLYADSLHWNPISINGRTSLFDNKVNLNFGGRFDPYALNENGKVMNEFEWNETGKLGRLTSFRVSANMNLGPDGGKGQSSQSQGGQGRGADQMAGPVNPYTYFHVPWNVSIGYSFNYSKPAFESRIQQTIDLRGDFSLTENWQFNFTAFYDISEDELATAELGISRNLHCWSMSFQWYPVGRRKGYFFEIRVNSSILQDLKLKKQDYRYDF